MCMCVSVWLCRALFRPVPAQQLALTPAAPSCCLPLLLPGLGTALLVVFVDVIKELPATLVLRPFNFDTLATRVFRLASDERLAEASTAALLIVLLGLIPTLFLTRR